MLQVGFGSSVEMFRLELLHWPDAGAFSTNFHDLNLKQDPPKSLLKSELFISRTVERKETIGLNIL